MQMRLTEFNLLEELAKPEYADILSGFHRRAIAKSAFVCSPDQDENLVFIVAAGRARVYLASDVREFTLSILEPGDIYSTHTGTYVQAMEDMDVLVTPIADFTRHVTAFPKFTKTMVRVLGDMLKSSFATIDALVFKDISRRLASFLAGEARARGRATPDGMLLDLDLTTEELARMVGATRQTVSTLLNDMDRAGLLALGGRSVFLIPDPDKLEQEAGS
jgi:CRP-like cAMP-binding protein